MYTRIYQSYIYVSIYLCMYIYIYIPLYIYIFTYHCICSPPNLPIFFVSRTLLFEVPTQRPSPTSPPTEAQMVVSWRFRGNIMRRSNAINLHVLLRYSNPKAFDLGFGVSINGGTHIAGWFIMENPIEMDDLGVPRF